MSRHMGAAVLAVCTERISYQPRPRGLSCQSWFVVYLHRYWRTFASRVVNLWSTSMHLALLTLMSWYWLAPTLLRYHCWLVAPVDCHAWMLPASSRLAPDTSRKVPVPWFLTV